MGINQTGAPRPEDVRTASEFLKGLANPNRLLIVCALVRGECSVGDMEEALGIRQPTLSQQLAALREAGLVATRRSNKQVFYRLANARVAGVVAELERVFCGKTKRSSIQSEKGTTPLTEARRDHGSAQFANVITLKPRVLT